MFWKSSAQYSQSMTNWFRKKCKKYFKVTNWPFSIHWASLVSSLSCQSNRLPLCCQCSGQSGAAVCYKCPSCLTTAWVKGPSLGSLTPGNATAWVIHFRLCALTRFHLSHWLCVRPLTHSLMGVVPPLSRAPGCSLLHVSYSWLSVLGFTLSISHWSFMIIPGTFCLTMEGFQASFFFFSLHFLGS